MKIIVVDDERLALESINELLGKIAPAAEVKSYRLASAALQAAESWRPDVALLDISMPAMNGIELAEKMQESQPHINIIFTTGYDSYTKEALDMHASGYLLKPITEEKLREEMAVLRFNVPSEVTAAADTPQLCVRAFGSFEVFCNGEPLHFQYRKTKELLAYLIDRNGTMCTNQELIGILWEEAIGDQKVPYLQRLRADLIAVLQECGAGDVLVRHRGEIGILPEKVDCDFYDWLRGQPRSTVPGDGIYHGEYMTQYSWAESTNGWLSEMAERKES